MLAVSLKPKRKPHPSYISTRFYEHGNYQTSSDLHHGTAEKGSGKLQERDVSKHAPALPPNPAKAGEGMLKQGFYPSHVRDGKSGYFSLRCGTALSWVFPGGEMPPAVQSLRAARACVRFQGWQFPCLELGVAATKVVVVFLLFLSLLNQNIRLQQKSAPKMKVFTSNALTQDI